MGLLEGDEPERGCDENRELSRCFQIVRAFAPSHCNAPSFDIKNTIMSSLLIDMDLKEAEAEVVRLVPAEQEVRTLQRLSPTHRLFAPPPLYFAATPHLHFASRCTSPSRVCSS